MNVTKVNHGLTHCLVSGNGFLMSLASYSSRCLFIMCFVYSFPCEKTPWWCGGVRGMEGRGSEKGTRGQGGNQINVLFIFYFTFSFDLFYDAAEVSWRAWNGRVKSVLASFYFYDVY